MNGLKKQALTYGLGAVLLCGAGAGIATYLPHPNIKNEDQSYEQVVSDIERSQQLPATEFRTALNEASERIMAIKTSLEKKYQDEHYTNGTRIDGFVAAATLELRADLLYVIARQTDEQEAKARLQQSLDEGHFQDIIRPYGEERWLFSFPLFVLAGCAAVCSLSYLRDAATQTPKPQ